MNNKMVNGTIFKETGKKVEGTDPMDMVKKACLGDDEVMMVYDEGVNMYEEYTNDMVREQEIRDEKIRETVNEYTDAQMDELERDIKEERDKEYTDAQEETDMEEHFEDKYEGDESDLY